MCVLECWHECAEVLHSSARHFLLRRTQLLVANIKVVVPLVLNDLLERNAALLRLQGG